MKTNKTILIILFLLSMGSFAQHSHSMSDKKEQIRSLKVGYITNELALTAEEATKFWPIYNAFDDKQFELRFQKIKVLKAQMEDEELDKMSEKEATALLAQIENNENELAQLRKKFILNLQTILTAKKILKLKKVEDNFNRKLLQQYRNKGIKK